jgi:hypothetical protein
MHAPSPSAWFASLLACAALAPAALFAVSTDDITSVSSKTSRDYVRTKLADGSFQPESYAFGEGGRIPGTVRDVSIDRLSFMDVAKVIAGPLNSQAYVPTRDPATTKLLILVYWGRTGTPMRGDESAETQNLQGASGKAADAKNSIAQQEVAAETLRTENGPGMVCGHIQSNTTVAQVDDQIDADNAMTGALAMVAAQERSREQQDAANAAVLGYDDLWAETAGYQSGPFEIRRRDLVEELEQSRYFVVLMAYDFQDMWKHKQHKLLWETRLSIRQRHHAFDRDLSSIVRYASEYFGQDTHGLIRKELPPGRVDVGDVKSLGIVQDH